jgi:hypothetical protein
MLECQSICTPSAQFRRDVAIFLSRASEMRQLARQDAGWCCLLQGCLGAAILEQQCARENSIRMSSQSFDLTPLTKDERFTRLRTGLGTFRAIGIY